MKFIYNELTFDKIKFNLSELTFLHHSASQLKNFKAPTYKKLKQVRLNYFDNDIKATNRYLKSRKEEENKYHELLDSDKSKTFNKI
jgi:hypothetical protein